MSGPPRDEHEHRLSREWVDKLEIREVIERSVRYIDDGAADRFAELFDEDGVMQLAGTVFEGREALAAMSETSPRPWTEPGELLKQPASMHMTCNPVIEVTGDTATAETDMVTLVRDEHGRAKITLVARVPRPLPTRRPRPLAHHEPDRGLHRPARRGRHRRGVGTHARGVAGRRARPLPPRRLTDRKGVLPCSCR